MHRISIDLKPCVAEWTVVGGSMCVCSPENGWGSDDLTSKQMTGSPGGEATRLRCTAVCILLDVVLPGGVGSFWKTVSRTSQTGIARQRLDEQVWWRRSAFFASLRDLMNGRGVEHASLFLQSRRGHLQTSSALAQSTTRTGGNLLTCGSAMPSRAR